MVTKTNDPTDLTEKQWQIIKTFIPKQQKGPKQIGRRRGTWLRCCKKRQGMQAAYHGGYVGVDHGDCHYSKDYERNPESSKAMIHIAMTTRMLKWLEKHDVASERHILMIFPIFKAH